MSVHSEPVLAGSPPHAHAQRGRTPVRDAAKVSPPSLTLADFLSEVGRILGAGLPRSVWLRVTVSACKATRFGHQLDLGDPCTSEARLQVFLPARALAAMSGAETIDPLLLVGLATSILVEPSFSGRWHLQGRVLDLGADARQSLERLRLDRLRAQLKAERLYDRQRSLRAPADIVRVAIVHPAGAAGWADIAGELECWQRAGILTVISVPATFEGPRAGADLVAALDRAAAGEGAAPDLVLIVRGGGDRAGLMVLDDERVARAVCRCPVPVITGLGHAVDRSLVDEVAWTAQDTPSKALAHLASLIVEPARRARADWAMIAVEADRLTGAAAHALDLARHHMSSAAERRHATALSAAAAAWATARAGIAGAAERCGRLDDGARRLLGVVLDLAPLQLEAATRAAWHRYDDAFDSIARRAGRADDGAALIARIVVRVQAIVEASSLDLTRRIDGALLDAGRGHAGTELDLDRLMGLAESLGLDATLGRGFTLALGPDGTLVSTRAAALAAETLILRFVDGAVAARVEPLLTAMTGETV